MSERERILIVEDEWLIALDYATSIKKQGHDVVGPFASVAAALKALDQKCPDAALLDIRLNGEDSFPVADALVQANVPFAFLTGFAERSLPARFQGRPVVAKPVTSETILSILELLFTVRYN